MASNNNIFYATNPAKISDALWQIINIEKIPLSEMLIFLPSRRAVRMVEKMLVDRTGNSLILPHLIALGEGIDDFTDEYDDNITNDEPISNMSRVITLAKLLSNDASIRNLSTALPVAHDLVRMTDYLENEGVDISKINWDTLVDDTYAAHFQHKARLLNILTQFASDYMGNQLTTAAARNRGIRDWIKMLDKFQLVIVCASTASVPATADLMAAVANLKQGRIILSGKISGNTNDFELATNPYNAEYKFLQRIGITQSDISPIDVGPSAIDFMNHAFGNNTTRFNNPNAVGHCHLIECDRESEEAAAVAEIAARAMHDNKTVLVITPDAAGNQRIASALAARNIPADFSSATPGTMTLAGRAILNIFDDWINTRATTFEKLFTQSGNNLLKTIITIIDDSTYNFAPRFNIDDDASIEIWGAIKNLSDCLISADITELTTADARALLADAISAVGIRNQMNHDATVTILGNIESRMQTADIVILTGLNDGMFPARGYENSWLPRSTADAIGLPSPDKKVSLMALDFMNLSCGGEVYWLRSRTSGGVQTTQSRFLSRIQVAGGGFDTDIANDILASVRALDNVAPNPLDYSPPTPPADWSDVYVTELELLIHNPYAFYARHILRLRPLDDYWATPDARTFGNLVHSVIEHARDFSPDALIAQMDMQARTILGTDNILFHFWHRRFTEIAPIIASEFGPQKNSFSEIGGTIKIAGRNVRAYADRVWPGTVADIKTGAAPTLSQLMDGTMPQLPLEAYMMQHGGFPARSVPQCSAPTMMFLQLKSGNVCAIKYDAETTAKMIDAAVAKTTELFNMYSAGGAPYEYRQTNNRKYQAYDDLARCDD